MVDRDRKMCTDPATHAKVLTPFRFSDSLTYLLCVDCKEVVAIWTSSEEDRSKPIPEEKLKEWA